MWPVCLIVLFGTTIFLGAFLLFQVQPLMGRFLLPWFGGTPDVWTACMLFFQLFLLAGYGWAHLNSRWFSLRQQAINQVLLLILAVATLSIVPAESLKPLPGENPLLRILLICSVCVGLPYFILSTTGPMLQAWLARFFPGAVPYRFYALGNTGSLLALLSFPFLFEPQMARPAIAKVWSAGFLLYALIAIAAAMKSSSCSSIMSSDSRIESAPLSKKQLLLWIALPACASIELLAVTTTVTQDIAVIPFLWIVPLCLYLLSFIICFDHPRWYQRPVFLTLFMFSMAGVIYARNAGDSLGAVTLISLYMAMLFFCTMVCHGAVSASSAIVASDGVLSGHCRRRCLGRYFCSCDCSAGI